MAKIISVANQTINDGVEGQKNAKIEVRVKDFAVSNEAQMEFNGQMYTGVVSIVPRFFMTVSDGQGGTREVNLVQGLPNSFIYPSEIFETWRLAETGVVQLSTIFPERINEELVYVLRRIVSTEITVPLFGLGNRTDWTIDAERSAPK